MKKLITYTQRWQGLVINKEWKAWCRFGVHQLNAR